MLDFNGDVVGQPGPFAVEGFHDGYGVAGSVEEIGVAKRDVGGAGGDLTANVLENDIALHNAEEAAIDGNHGTVPAEMFATAGCFGIADAASAIGHDQLRVRSEGR